MQPSDSSKDEITKAIEILKNAIGRHAADNKAVHDDLVQAANILNSLVGLSAVGPDTGRGL